MAGTALLLIAAATDQLAVLLVAFATLSTGYGLIAPSTAALALMSHPERAGCRGGPARSDSVRRRGACRIARRARRREQHHRPVVAGSGCLTAVTVVLAAVLNGGPGMRVGSPDPS